MELFKSIIGTEMTVIVFIVIILSSFILGICTTIAFHFHSNFSKGFMITLSLISAVVAVLIIMVNGNLGTGIAVAGAFSLVRFRSAPGSAKEICAIFATTAIGIILGMGYIAFAIIFTLLICTVYILLNLIKGFDQKVKYKTLKITVPEDLNYDNVFDDILNKYTKSYELLHVKSINLGSMFKLTYRIVEPKEFTFKPLLDEIRCLNGNLEVMISKDELCDSEL